jgi:hypothetical protein
MIGSTTVEADDAVTTLSTPGGRPCSANRAAIRFIDSGVSCAGFTIMVQPAAIAGAILRAPIASGKFHGVTSRQGPTGCLSVSRRPEPLGSLDHRPLMRTASSANQRKNSAAYFTSAAASASGLPISSVTSSARSSTRAIMVS